MYKRQGLTEQRVEHYEMAAYGSAYEFPRLLGEGAIVSLLEARLGEEKAADQKRTTIAQSVNAEAQSAGAEEDFEDDEEEAKKRQNSSPPSRSRLRRSLP